jgi:hypothetical protein
VQDLQDVRSELLSHQDCDKTRVRALGLDGDRADTAAGFGQAAAGTSLVAVAVAAGIGFDALAGIEYLVLTGIGALVTAETFVGMVVEASRENQSLGSGSGASVVDTVDISGFGGVETVHDGWEVPMDCGLVDQKILFQHVYQELAWVQLGWITESSSGVSVLDWAVFGQEEMIDQCCAPEREYLQQFLLVQLRSRSACELKAPGELVGQH